MQKSRPSSPPQCRGPKAEELGGVRPDPDELKAMGIVVEDTPQGHEVAPRLTKGGRHERFPVCQIPDLQWDFRCFLILAVVLQSGIRTVGA